MNFFEQQERAKRNTSKLVVLMCLAVISLIAISSVAVAAILALLGQRDPNAPVTAGSWFTQMTALLDWHLVGTISVLVIGVVVAGILFKHFQLRSGGKAVAESLNGRPIDPGTTDLEEQKVLNVVEEMAIASGIPVPPVYVMEDESINAFAAGHTPQDAVIGVTRGCISLLSRDELQGVVAHEFSHIFHGDMRLNTKLVATLNGILLIGLVGYILLRSAPFRRGNSKDNAALIMLAIGIVLIVVGFAGTFFGNLIKSAVSRQREFLADASSVQFTRNPAGIANALKKIGGYHAGSQIQAANASEYSHMFFSRAIGNAFSTFMATHPPLEQRIRRVQPDWDGSFTAPQPEPALEPRPDIDRSRATRDVLRAAAAVTLTDGQSPAQATPLRANASQDAIEAIGRPSTRHVAYAQQIIAALDPELREAAHDIYSARALIYGLLLDRSETVRPRQLTALEQNAEPDAYRYVNKLSAKLAALDPRSRLPLVALALPALKQLSSAQYITFKRCLGQLIMADKQISLMEWALYRIVIHNIEPPPRRPSRAALGSLRDECQVLLSALVHAGHMDASETRTAFDAAASSLPFKGLELLPRDAVSTATLEPAVNHLCNMGPSDKRPLMQALARAVEHDGFVTVTQAELLRAIADSLNCPLPPLLADADLQ
ncbi:Zn-dependent protease with chaperone function [Pusillimonas sp. T7-7]|uniref:M48 family metallopeptidase n=1 Tax=Pusillimonas sp. (strain T7-7) TaxID=1007105 RepID=UPI0002084465|nr:M48 family metalloprotease [Pusillimonas sp. T7-7]AEC19217.1 Zn-dependent protease with chaperone function [Pusillimonas sp. T7-7]